MNTRFLLLRQLFVLGVISCFMVSCEDEVVIKPKALLRLEYPLPKYSMVNQGCPFSFAQNQISQLERKTGCNLNIRYPSMKATLYLTYQEVKEGNLNNLLRDAQKLAYDHTIKANAIPEQPFVNSDGNVYGMYYPIDGNAATQAHFYATDSLQHFITGSLYFETIPNFDSLYPAIVYLRKDIRTLMESLSWQSAP